MKLLTAMDALIGPLVLILILFHASYIKRKRSQTDPAYRYFFRGAIFKLVGTAGFCLIYLFYFKGGDTFDYHKSCTAMINLMFTDFGYFLDVMTESKVEYFSYFDSQTGYPNFRHFMDAQTFNVSRVLVFVELLCFNSYIATSILASYICYLGLWRVYLIFVRYFPDHSRELFFLSLCFPSVLFWSGGLSKEVIIMTLLGAVLWCVYRIFISEKRSLIHILWLLLAVFLIINIKPYIFIALFPAIVLWVSFKWLFRVKQYWLRAFLLPATLVTSLGMAFGIWQLTSSSLGEYSNVNSMLEKAVVSQQDLQNERYEGSSFNIGKFDATPSAVLAKFPQATFAGLFRPLLIEANNAVMLLSGLENLILIIMVLIALFRIGRSSRLMLSNELLIFCLIFSIIFAFAIGISTSNFGALVRFKIPLLPFFGGMLVILSYRPKTKEATPQPIQQLRQSA